MVLARGGRAGTTIIQQIDVASWSNCRMISVIVGDIAESRRWSRAAQAAAAAAKKAAAEEQKAQPPPPPPPAAPGEDLMNEALPREARGPADERLRQAARHAADEGNLTGEGSGYNLHEARLA